MTVNAKQRRGGGKRGPVAFKQRDFTRAARGAAKAGIDVGEYRFSKDGFVIVPKSAMPDAGDTASPINPWDEDLPDAANSKRSA